MKWVDGSEIDIKQFTGASLCEKLALEMWKNGEELWLQCPVFLQNALYILAFDTETNMEGFSTPNDGNITPENYARIISAFRAIGDAQDAAVLEEVLSLDAAYQQRLAQAENDDETDEIHDEYSDKLEELEQKLYLNTDFEMWALLYQYLDEQLRLAE
jgi:hypothetical protein